MASPYLTSLRRLHEHAARLRQLGTNGNWDALAREAADNPALFAAYQSEAATPPPPGEREEARRLLQEILASYQGLSAQAGPWLQDVDILLKGMGGR